MEYFHKGNNHYIEEDYNDAEASYSEAITEYEKSLKLNNNNINQLNNETLSRLYLHRGTTYLKIKKYYEALEDLDACIRLDPSIEIAYYRKGITYFELEEYESAKDYFTRGLQLRQSQHKNSRDTSAYTRYIRKCDVEIKGEIKQMLLFYVFYLWVEVSL